MSCATWRAIQLFVKGDRPELARSCRWMLAHGFAVARCRACEACELWDGALVTALRRLRGEELH